MNLSSIEFGRRDFRRLDEEIQLAQLRNDCSASLRDFS
jgi:hypothetical protein